MKAVKQHLQETKPERVAEFEKGAQGFAKQIVGNFKDYEFYVGESMNPEGMVALLVSDMGSLDFSCYFQDSAGGIIFTVPSFRLRSLLTSELPRGWCHTVLYLLEGRTQGGEHCSPSHRLGADVQVKI